MVNSLRLNAVPFSRRTKIWKAHWEKCTNDFHSILICRMDHNPQLAKKNASWRFWCGFPNENCCHKISLKIPVNVPMYDGTNIPVFLYLEGINIFTIETYFLGYTASMKLIWTVISLSFTKLLCIFSAMQSLSRKGLLKGALLSYRLELGLVVLHATWSYRFSKNPTASSRISKIAWTTVTVKEFPAIWYRAPEGRSSMFTGKSSWRMPCAAKTSTGFAKSLLFVNHSWFAWLLVMHGKRL